MRGRGSTAEPRPLRPRSGAAPAEEPHAAPSPRPRLPRQHFVVTLVCAVLLTTTACAPTPDSRAEARPNLVLAVIDTLRADHLTLYGYPRPTSPTLDRLAPESAVFTQARAQAPCTFPSANSLLTSRPTWVFSGRPEGRLGIPAGIPTVASRLRAAGYRTAAVSASPVVRDTPSRLNREGGFGAGFDLFLEDCLWRDGSCVQRRAERALGLLPEPFFLYLHYLDPHDPYRPPPGAPAFAGRPPAGASPAVAAGDPVPAARRLYADGDAALSAAELDHLRDRYDEEVAWADRQLAALDALLRRRGVAGRTLLVVTADHGESFLEHGHLRHCRSLFDEELRVPLLVRPPAGNRAAPRAGGRRIDDPVALLDVTPTLLDYAGIGGEGGGGREGGWAGRSLRGHVEAGGVTGAAGAAGVAAGVADAVAVGVGDQASIPVTASAGTRRALVLGRWKLIHDLDGGESWLYDLVADPGEAQDLAAADPDTLRLLLALLDRRLRAVEGEGLAVTAPRLDRSRETDRQLRALGYLQ